MSEGLRDWDLWYVALIIALNGGVAIWGFVKPRLVLTLDNYALGVL
jgi:hypothetical protein